MTEAVTDEPSGTKETSSAPSAQRFERVMHMTKGAGHDSYNKNSGAQAKVVGRVALPVFGSVLERVVLPAHGPVVVADLGCSSGQNSISHVNFIVEKLKARFLDSASPIPEFQIFFNDLPSNDFNNLFELFSASEKKQDFFAAGVPGSFYGRLFPRSSVHVFLSSLCLHWLSKMPDAVLDKRSPAYNKGKVWVNGSSPAVGAAYKEQASSDLKNFLDARAAELVPGGLLFFIIMGRCSPEPNKQMVPTEPSGLDSIFTTLSEACWSDLISEGIVTEEQRDDFNLPIFSRTVEEVKEAVESCSSAFEVVTNKLQAENSNFAHIFQTREPVELSKKMTGLTKALMNSLLEDSLGKEVTELYWQHFQKLALEIEVPLVLAHPERQDWTLMLALVRK